MSGLFDDEDGVVPGSKETPPAAPAPVAEEVGLFSDEAKAEMRAAKEKAKAVAKEKAKQAGQAATAVAQRARAEWLPKAKAWFQAERAKGVRKGVWIFGGGLALLTVAASAGIYWHARPHVEAPKVAVAAPAPAASTAPIAAPVAQVPVPTPAPSPVPQPQVAPAPAPIAAPVPVAQVPAPTPAAPVASAPQAAPVLKPVAFNPTSPQFQAPAHAASKPAHKPAPKSKGKTAWEKDQEAKLDAFFKH